MSKRVKITKRGGDVFWVDGAHGFGQVEFNSVLGEWVARWVNKPLRMRDGKGFATCEQALQFVQCNIV